MITNGPPKSTAFLVIHHYQVAIPAVTVASPNCLQPLEDGRFVHSATDALVDSLDGLGEKVISRLVNPHISNEPACLPGTSSCPASITNSDSTTITFSHPVDRLTGSIS